MTWTAKRKLKYTLSFTGIAIVLIGVPLILALHEDPTCFDGAQNQKEDGIDCGGPCVKLCKPLELLPVVRWEQAFKVSEGVYSAVAYIQNPNLNAEAFNVPYKFILYGESGVVAERTGTVYIPPGKSFVVFESNFIIGKQTVRRTEFDFDKNFTWHAAKKKPDMKVENIFLTDATTTPAINADIDNPSITNLGKITVTAIVYDPNGNAFAASRTYLDRLDRQSRGHVVFTWPEPFDRTAAKIEIIPIAE